MKLSDYVFKFVAGLGIKHVFMLSGGGAMHLVDSVGKNKKLSYICNLHEQACAIAADAYSQYTNKIGVALVTTGPGGTNTITGVAGAWLDSTPLLILSGQVKRPDMIGHSGVRQMGFQEIDIVSVVSPITKYATTVINPEKIRYELEKAVYLAKHGRPGPVWIDIPLDVQAAQIDEKNLPGFKPDIPDAASAQNQKSLTKKVSAII
ncbi:MAG TPA: thiamine pyrophosphate-binding protein, partial [Smithellaceae bacterium]|nr:thiamine pyrophosphate-binding protein [Smithellaceae bacterium]